MCQCVTNDFVINYYRYYMAIVNSLVHFKYFSGCIVCFSNGSLNLIWFILPHVMCIFVTHVMSLCPHCRNKFYLLICKMAISHHLGRPRTQSILLYNQLISCDSAVCGVSRVTLFLLRALWLSMYFCWEPCGCSCVSVESLVAVHVFLLRALWLFMCFCWEPCGCSRVSVESLVAVHVFLLRAFWLFTCFCWEPCGSSRVSVESLVAVHVFLLRALLLFTCFCWEPCGCSRVTNCWRYCFVKGSRENSHAAIIDWIFYLWRQNTLLPVVTDIGSCPLGYSVTLIA